MNLDLDKIVIGRALEYFGIQSKMFQKIKTVNKEVTDTKRDILIFVSSVFDPLGILSLTQLTRIIQDLWKQKIDCDEQIPADILQKW